MLISICIPQYNRIRFLLESLAIIQQQTYGDIEIIISDDCSTDNTQASIIALKATYKYPIVYSRNEKNLGYDRNLRAAVELANGEYVLILGNDDTINPEYDIESLVNFIEQNNYPSVGFANYMDAGSSIITRRAQSTRILGSGSEVALKYYSCFSFVAGIVFKKATFLRYNTSKFDGSIYAEIYLGCVPIASGENLFSIQEPVIIKDVLSDANDRISYNDHLPRKWSDFKKLDGGLPSVLNVLLSVFQDTKTLNQKIIYRAFRKMYSTTLPFWILEYRKQKAFPAAIGLIGGMAPCGI